MRRRGESVRGGSAAEGLLRFGNRILTVIAAVLILVMLLYGGYSLWDTAMINHRALDMDELLKYKPSGEDDNPTLDELRQQNPDVRAWITVDDTHIDYPVVQGEDDMEYINKDVYGEFFLPGSIFLSCLNQPDFSDSYNLLYGHHMRNGGMFGDIAEFQKEGYFKKHRTGTLYLPGSTHPVEIFACVKTDAFDNVIYQPDGYHEDNQDALLAYIREQAVQYRDVGVTAADQIIGLSTCSETETNGRVIVFGKVKKS